MYDGKIFGANLRKYRRRKAWTQSQLAEQLFVTAQNVSKWELGQALPDLNNLCRLAQSLEVSTDLLLGISQEKQPRRNFIAIDGGGTKTEFLLFSEDGEILGRRILPASNPNTCGIQGTQTVLQQGIDAFLNQGHGVAGVYAGIAGCGLRKNRRAILDFLEKKYPFLSFEVQTDIYNVMYSASDEENCMAAICGTGSVVYVKEGEQLHRLGGWGVLFDRGGNGYTMGRDVLRAALAYEEKSGPPTQLLALVEETLGGCLWDNVGQIYAKPPEYVASFCEVLWRAIEEGDTIAKNILRENMAELAYFIRQAVELYPAQKKVILSGGILSNHSDAFSLLQEQLPPECELILAEKPQIIGAAMGAIRKFGTPSAEVREILWRFYQGERNDDTQDRTT